MSKKTYSICIDPILITRGEWEVAKTEDSDPTFSFSLGSPVARRDGTGSRSFPRHDAFEVWWKLFPIKDADQMLKFFQAFGPWTIDKKSGNRAPTIRFSAILQRRAFFEDALLNRKIWSIRKASADDEIATLFDEYYLWQNLPMELVFTQPPSVIVRCLDIEESLRAAVFLKRIDGLPWKRCAREDCRKLFKMESKHRRMYCDGDCAHLQSVRSYNERQRVAAQKAKASGKMKKGLKA